MKEGVYERVGPEGDRYTVFHMHIDQESEGWKTIKKAKATKGVFKWEGKRYFVTGIDKTYEIGEHEGVGDNQTGPNVAEDWQVLSQ